MNNEELIALAIAGIAVWMILSRKARAATSSPIASPVAGSYFDALLGNASGTYATEIQNSALPGQPGWGWKYFSDGTVIDPNGAYYSGGQKVWQP